LINNNYFWVCWIVFEQLVVNTPDKQSGLVFEDFYIFLQIEFNFYLCMWIVQDNGFHYIFFILLILEVSVLTPLTNPWTRADLYIWNKCHWSNGEQFVHQQLYTYFGKKHLGYRWWGNTFLRKYRPKLQLWDILVKCSFFIVVKTHISCG
jgi:hypothetical protein